MCTVVFLYRPDHVWPLILAGNRDEMQGRPALPPARHWPNQPDIVAGMDQLAGGSWLGMNPSGVVSVVLNRFAALGPAAGKQSRGELVLQALRHSSAKQAALQMATLSGQNYRPFNLLIADASGCYWIRNREEQGEAQVDLITIPPGLHMLTAHELDDESSPRIRTWQPSFQKAVTPVPELGDWGGWLSLLASRDYPQDLGVHSAMNISLVDGFATVSSSLIALPAKTSSQNPIWLFADGAPDKVDYLPVVV